MERIPLGRSGLAVPPVIFGGNVFGWTADKAQSFRLLDAMVDAGLNAIDTADVYSAWAPGNQGGESENIIGEWLRARGRRQDVLIFTKVGMNMPGVGVGLAPARIEQAVDASLGGGGGATGEPASRLASAPAAGASLPRLNMAAM